LKSHQITDWLPTTKKEVEQRGWEELDVILFSGDAYVDHPSFGIPIIGRIIERAGFRVAIVPQPNWRDDLRDFKKLGKPRLFFGVSSGCMDSMVNHYTANKRLRSDDAYTAGNKAGFRPDYATSVYSKILKELYPDVPVIIGGIEASMRRFTHYDYWSDSVMPSILINSQADLLTYGMGEQGMRDILNFYKKGERFEDFKDKIPQTAFLSDDIMGENEAFLPSHEDCLKDKKQFAQAFKIVEDLSNGVHSKRIIQKVDQQMIVANPPYPLMTTEELDAVYDLPFTREPHPKYKNRGEIPAYNMIRHSVNIHRGCFGGCSFCTISMHQGKQITSRSENSILKEVKAIKQMPDFGGTITDLGGPSANMYQMRGIDPAQCEKCKRATCLFPKVCSNLNSDHTPLITLYRKVRREVPKVFIGSGIRYDLFMGFPKETAQKYQHDLYFEELFLHHVGGRLKVAPEHVSDNVLKHIRKPAFSMFETLKFHFEALNKKHHKRRQLIPYFISSLPACDLQDMASLMQKTKQLGYKLEQVQDFTPTPMTLATTLYYAEYDPYSQKPVFIPKTKQERTEQQRFFFWYKPENRAWTEQMVQKFAKKHNKQPKKPHKKR
jgi:uncharacterized radical SAM protein YgiQ